MDKKTAGIILSSLGGLGLILAMINFLKALNAVNINADSSPDFSNFVSAAAWGIPGMILVVIGIRFIQGARTL